MIFIMKGIIILAICLGNSFIANAFPPNGCQTGWTPYLDQKCFIALESVGTESEAESACTKLDSSSTLITIHSDQEEQFVAKYLATFVHISESAWLGLKWSGSSFAWIDNSQMDYKSWGKEALLDGSLKCGDISLSTYTLGNWTDDPCNKKHLIACQVNQMTLATLAKELVDLKNKVKTLEANQIQIGFIYTQLPNQTSPQDIWPNMKWTDVSTDYAGLFFRTEGGGSSPFGQIQPANYSRFLSTTTKGLTGVSYTGKGSYVQSFMDEGKWTGIVPDDALYALGIFMTTGENRPINTAIRLWKRVE